MIASREIAETVIRRRAMKKGKSYTITEASRKLGLTRQTLHEAIQKGQLEAKKGQLVQTVWLIPETALDQYRKFRSRKHSKKTKIDKA